MALPEEFERPGVPEYFPAQVIGADVEEHDYSPQRTLELRANRCPLRLTKSSRAMCGSLS